MSNIKTTLSRNSLTECSVLVLNHIYKPFMSPLSNYQSNFFAMMVQPVNQTFVSLDAFQFDQSVVGERKDVFPKMRMEEGVVEADQESGESSTEEAEQESPKSVAKFGTKKLGKFLHSQVLRVKEEELLLRENICGESCLSNKKERKKSYSCQESHVNVVVFARPILPFSPLSGKTTTTRSPQATVH